MSKNLNDSKRSGHVSSGVRKTKQSLNLGRRAPAWADITGAHFIRHQDAGRWPSDESRDQYARVNAARPTRRPDRPIKPSRSNFSLFDMAIHTEAHRNRDLGTLLMCACMTGMKMSRAPWYRLVKTHAMGNRVLNLEV